MQNMHLSNFEEKVLAAVSVPSARPDFVESLWEQLAEQPEHKRSYLFNIAGAFRPVWWALTLIALIIALLFFVLGPQRVLAAVQSFFNNLPGVGVVRDLDQVAVLAAPVQQERDGVTVTVEALVASSERSWLRMKVEGAEDEPDNWDRASRQSLWPQLKTVGQAALPANQSDVYQGDVLYAEFQFPGLPKDVQEVTFSLPDVLLSGQGSALKDWKFSLHLRSVEASDLLPAAWSRPRESALGNGVSMSLLQVIQRSDQTLLTVRMNPPTLNSTLSPEWFSQLSLSDGQGRIYPLTQVESMGGRTAVFKTRPLDGSQRFTLRLDRLLLVDEPSVEPSAPVFTVDFGPAPSVGQRWAVDQTLESGAFQIHVVGVELTADASGAGKLVFDVERPDGGVQGLMFGCAQLVCTRAETADLSFSQASLLHPVLYLSQIPAGRQTFTLERIYFPVEGPWTVVWQPADQPDLAFHARSTPTAATPLAAVVDPSRSIPLNSALSTPDAEPPNAALAEEVRSLLEKGFQALYSQPGWVHVVYEDIEPESTADFENGKIGPAYSLGETWQDVDAAGIVQRQVWIEKTADGVVWQKIARVGKTSVNFTAGTAVDDEKLLTRAMMDRLPDLLLNPHLAGKAVREEGLLEDHPCLIITIKTDYDPPLTDSSVRQRVRQSDQKTWIDRQSGQIRMEQNSIWLEDGSQLITQTMRYPVKERVAGPPQEVLDLLQQVVP